MSRIAELLVSQNVIEASMLQKITEFASNNSVPVISAITKMDLVKEPNLLEMISKHYNLQIIDLDKLDRDKNVTSLISPDLSKKHIIMPLSLEGNTLTVAMSDPSNIAALNDIRFITGYDIRVRLAAYSQLSSIIEKTYEAEISYDDLFGSIEGEDVSFVAAEDDVDLAALEKATEDAPVVKLVNAILTDAIKRGTSDIHIEPYEKSFRVRFRIDGVLYEIMKPPLKLKNAITSRLKIMASLDIAERRLPQDGRIKLKLGRSKEMDFRVSVLPGLFGEKIVLRLLDKSNLQTDMTKLGFFDDQLTDFMAAINKPFGLVLVTGPTGSGKTTTLYSALAELNDDEVNVSTAEDPVEFNLFGINQVQMHEDIGLNFAAALRSFLRQDPDIIMVGEIRDYETAEIAIKASLTGHLVLSTLHTNDAPATVNRLLNMGIEPFLVASSINIIIAQRLARRICTNCKEETSLDPEALINLGVPAAEAKHIKLYKGKGCPKCSDTGYKGRVALYEAMVMTEDLKNLVLNGASAAEIKQGAIRGGMKTLRASGIVQIKIGVTTIEEVLRVTTAD